MSASTRKPKKTIIVPPPRKTDRNTRRKKIPQIKLLPKPVFLTKRLAVCEIGLRGDRGFWTILFLGMMLTKGGYCDTWCQPVVVATVDPQMRHREITAYRLSMLTAHEWLYTEGYAEELLAGLKKHLGKDITADCAGADAFRKALVILPGDDADEDITEAADR